MNTDYNCKAIYKLLPLKTWSDKLFEWSSIELVCRRSLSGSVQKWTSSFNVQDYVSKSIFERRIETEKDFVNLIVGRLIEDYLAIRSVVDQFKYMMITSIINRFIEVVFLGLQNQVLQSNKLSSTMKPLINFGLSAIHFGLMVSLGYTSIQFLVFSLTPYMLSAIIPYKFTNWLREVDVLSKEKDSNNYDFIMRNALVFVRSLVISPMIANTAFEFWLFPNIVATLLKTIETNHSASFQFCERPGRELDSYMILEKNRSIAGLNFGMRRAGWIVGKILCDVATILVLKKLFKVEDLRDPLSSILPKSILKRIGSYEPKNKLARKIKLAKRRRQRNLRLAEQKRRHRQRGVRRRKFNRYSGWNPYQGVTITKRPRVKKHESGNNKKDTATETVPGSKRAERIKNIQKPIEEEKALFSFKQKVGNKNLEFVLLSMPNQPNDMNIWGVITKDKVKKGEIEIYHRSLNSGHIGPVASIKPLKHEKHKYEIRPKGYNGRLMGTAHIDSDIYGALKSHMQIEDALKISRTLEEASKKTMLITFDEEKGKHRKG